MKELVNVVVCGDTTVGKSSLITCLVAEAFPEKVEDVVDVVTIPPEGTPDHVTARIIDTASPSQEKGNAAMQPQTEAHIKEADALILIYDITKPKTFDRITSFWLPAFRRLGKSCPVVLAGNKIDTRGDKVTNTNLERDIMPVMNQFKEVETCVECSAKNLVNIAEVFYFALKTVVHPTAPLYDASLHTLRDKCKNALERIFKLCDIDKDGILNDLELNAFQRKCFGAPLHDDELKGVKHVVSEHVPDGVENNGLTLAGFVYLHTLFIQRGRLETTWTVLRKFGYDDTLEITPALMNPPFAVKPDEVAELSTDGVDFFTALFKRCDLDKDGALNDEELEILFSTTPGCPWGKEFPKNMAVTDANGNLTLDGFLAQWHAVCLSDPAVVFQHLFLLGYYGDVREGVRLVKRGHGKKRKTHRTTFRALVVGDDQCGKTSFLRGMLDSPVVTRKNKTNAIPSQVCRAFAMEDDTKYIVLSEAHDGLELIQQKEKLADADVICMLYDQTNPSSFAYAAQVVNAAIEDQSHVPVICVATKSDKEAVDQVFADHITPEDRDLKAKALEAKATSTAPSPPTEDTGAGVGSSPSSSQAPPPTASQDEEAPTDLITPEDFLQARGLPNPVRVSVKRGETANVYEMILAVAESPHVSMPHAAGAGEGAGIAATAGVLGYVAYTLYQGKRLFKRS